MLFRDNRSIMCVQDVLTSGNRNTYVYTEHGCAKLLGEPFCVGPSLSVNARSISIRVGVFNRNGLLTSLHLDYAEHRSEYLVV